MMLDFFIDKPFCSEHKNKQFLKHLTKDITVLEPEEKIKQNLKILEIPDTIKNLMAVESKTGVNKLNDLGLIDCEILTYAQLS
jgi:hypothetical protein